MQLNISEWRPASITVGKEVVFAVGDVHGCSEHLFVLLEGMRELARDAGPSRLVFTGDLIGKGANGLSTLNQWASTDLDNSFVRVDRLFGNHEQMLLLAISDKSIAGEAEAQWMKVGGDVFVDELRSAARMPGTPLTASLLKAGMNDYVVAVLQRLKSHVGIGSLIFVHAGIDPNLGIYESLAAPWDVISDNHWAWIKGPFLKHTDGFDSITIVHGHTVPEQHHELSGRPDPHMLEFGRLSLDGGSTLTGVVMGAQFEDGRYRLVFASS